MYKRVERNGGGDKFTYQQYKINFNKVIHTLHIYQLIEPVLAPFYNKFISSILMTYKQ